jgi:peptide/nickel transport system permease protein
VSINPRLSIDSVEADAGQDLGVPEDPELGPQVLEQKGVRGYFARHSMTAYVTRRFALYVFTLWAAISATFIFFRLIPGDPISAYIQNLRSQYAENASASAAVINHYKAVFGLDGGLFSQYGHFMTQLVLHRNFGPSLLEYPTPAQDVVAHALPWTIGLLFTSAIIAWVLGTLLGAFAGWRRSSKISEAATWFSVTMAPVPFYFIGLVTVFLLAYRLTIFPPGEPFSANVHQGFNLPFIGSVLDHAILPAFSIVFVTVLGTLLAMRQQMISVLGEDYLTFAQAKGLPPRRILTRYAMANCYLPQITALAISFGVIFGGNVLVEELFQYPGVGYTLVKAIGVLDLNTVMCISCLAIFGVLTAVFILDLVMPLLDPRIKYTR